MQEGTSQGCIFSAGFVNGTIDIWAWIILYVGAVLCLEAASLASTYQVLVATLSIPLRSWQPNGSLDIARDLWVAKLPSAENPWFTGRYESGVNHQGLLIQQSPHTTTDVAPQLTFVCYIIILTFWVCAGYFYWCLCFWKAVLCFRGSTLVCGTWAC